MALKLRSTKCSQPRSCNETRSWKQYYQLHDLGWLHFVDL